MRRPADQFRHAGHPAARRRRRIPAASVGCRPPSGPGAAIQYSASWPVANPLPPPVNPAYRQGDGRVCRIDWHVVVAPSPAASTVPCGWISSTKPDQQIPHQLPAGQTRPAEIRAVRPSLNTHEIPRRVIAYGRRHQQTPPGGVVGELGVDFALGGGVGQPGPRRPRRSRRLPGRSVSYRGAG